MPTSPFTQYLDKIQANLAGSAVEHTHRPALVNLIESFTTTAGHKITAFNEQKRIFCGAPDVEVSKRAGGNVFRLGYIEAKDIGHDLSSIGRDSDRSSPSTSDGKQVRSYRAAIPNLILTDYLDFRWYVDGEFRKSARLATISVAGKLVPDRAGQNDARDLLTEFLDHTPQPIATAKELANRMAKLTHEIRDRIVQAFEKGQASATLGELKEAFEKTLIPDLKPEDFADMFAQTLAYGLFAARCNHKEPAPFQRLGSAREIPKTNPFLRRLFDSITGVELDDEPFVGFVDDLAQLLAHADMSAILAEFGRRTGQQDPILHFYETFLAAYDPKLREKRGVYYTPESVVSYIVRSVDYLLKTRFNCPDGLADSAKVQYQVTDESGKQRTETSHKVLLLDPACGTGTFLYAVIDLIRQRYVESNNAGMWSGYVQQDLLPRLFGFELLMAPYAVAHLKLGMQLAGQDMSDAQREIWRYDFAGDERLGVYLTNSLEKAEEKIAGLFGLERIITEEANAAAAIKRDKPIMVVLGNPPYSGHSANASWRETKNVQTGKKSRERTWIGALLDDYYQVDGQPLGERNPKWLQDDYVKFIRFGQWRIEKTGAGVLAFITNHGYLDNPTFRGMRQQLMNSFTDIYLLNLHGNSKKRERAPDGGPDENVFDIEQGVAVGIFVKEAGKGGPARVYHADLWGKREGNDGKYAWLAEQSVEMTGWTTLAPDSPFYLFTPQDISLRSEYERGWKVTEAMPVNTVGVVTGQDANTIADTQPEAERLARLHSLPKTTVKAILYRPFDLRYIVYAQQVVTRPRSEVMRHMLAGKNIAIICPRRVEVAGGWQHCLATSKIVDHVIVSSKTIDSLLPLYFYPSEQEIAGRLYRADERRPNLAPAFVEDIAGRLSLSFVPDGRGDLEKTFGPEDVFHYIYSVFHSPTYRSRYAAFLKIDFPRVPLTSDVDLFRMLCQLGADLVALHLMEDSYPAASWKQPGATVTSPFSLLLTTYPVTGDNLVEPGHPRYVPPDGTQAGRVYINKGSATRPAQRFDGVPPEVWEFHVGGYQVCEKWLKDRRSRRLSYEDLTHYQRIVVALKETIRLMKEIDEAIPGWPVE